MEKPLSKSGILIIVLSSLAGLGLTIFAVNNSMNAMKTKSWPTAVGTVVSSEVQRSSRYVPKIVYSYAIRGSEFTSDKIGLTDFAQYKKKEDAARVAGAYPVNSKVTVYYNPGNAEEALLEPGIKGEHIFMSLMGLVIFIAPLLGLIYTSRKTK
jgi:hypothetical protein